MLHTLTIDRDQSKGTIRKDVYGHFAEHLGRGIYDGIWVGPNSSIAHTEGLRQDVLEALRAIHIPVLRWPGGCFADEYHWKDGIGRPEDRRTMVNSNWGGVVEDNQFGTHEFFRLCELLECDAYVSGNVGSGTVQEMQDWVEYITGPKASSMGGLRAKNGRNQPWRLKYFGVGNESWGCGGNMRAEYYADVYRQYQTFIRQYQREARIQKIASGSHDGDYHWTEVLMKSAAQLMDGISLHYYTIPGTWEHKGSATDFGPKEWFVTLKKALVLDDLLDQHGWVMDRYDPERKVGLVVDEWGTWYDVEPGTSKAFLFQQNTLRDALVAAISLNIFNNHCDRVTMANLAQTVNVLQALLLTQGSEMVKTPTYYVFQMYAAHQGNRQARVLTNSLMYAMEGEAISQIHNSASFDALGRCHLSMANLHPDHDATVEISVQGAEGGWPIGQAHGRYLSASRINACNTFDQPDQVVIRPMDATPVDGGKIRVVLPAKSVAQWVMQQAPSPTKL